MRHLQPAFALILAIVSAAQAKPATVWQVRGRVANNYFRKGIPGSNTTWFTASTSNGCSRIITRSPSNKGTEFFEYSSDGENSKLLVKFTPSVFPPGHPRRPANEATLTLSLGTVPDMSGQITPVWLAYASGGFYKASRHGETEPVHFMGTGFREQHIKLKSQWRLRKEPPYLLQSMCDFSGGYQPSPETGRVIQTPYRNTNSSYNVSAWTNVAGLVLPLEWQLIRYRVNLDTDLVEVSSAMSGSITNVEIGPANIDPPEVLPNNTRIVDYTLPAQGIPIRSYAYLVTNGQVRSLSELKGDKLFATALLHPDAVVIPHRRYGPMVLGLAVVLVLATTPLFFRHRRNSRTHATAFHTTAS